MSITNEGLSGSKNADIAIKTVALTKRYGSVVALDHLDLEVKRGEILGYLGPNGAGKTTTIRSILGLIKPTSGTAEIFGVDSQADKVLAHRQLAYVPGESIFWPSLTGAETLHLLGKVHGQIDLKYQNELIKRFNSSQIKKSEPIQKAIVRRSI